MAWVFAHLQPIENCTKGTSEYFNSNIVSRMKPADTENFRASCSAVGSGRHQLQDGVVRRAARNIRVERPSTDAPQSRRVRRHLLGRRRPAAAHHFPHCHCLEFATKRRSRINPKRSAGQSGGVNFWVFTSKLTTHYSFNRPKQTETTWIERTKW